MRGKSCCGGGRGGGGRGGSGGNELKTDWGDLINSITTLVDIMAWHQLGNKPLFEPMVVSLLMHICVIQSQWVKYYICLHRCPKTKPWSMCALFALGNKPEIGSCLATEQVFSPWTASSVDIQDLTLVITVHADVLALNGVRPSAITVFSIKLNVHSSFWI